MFIDVNGWSFVKDNNEYYEKCASILRTMFVAHKSQAQNTAVSVPSENDESKDAGPPTAAPPVPRPSRKSTLGHRSLKDLLSRTPSSSKLNVRGSVASAETLASSEQSADRSSRANSAIPSPSRLPSTSESLSQSPDTASVRDSDLQLGAVPRKDLEDQTIASTDIEPPRSGNQRQSWKMKGMVSVIRHADRTPKQKFKFNFHTKPFVDLLRGHLEEVLLTGDFALRSVQDAISLALDEGIEDQDKLKLLQSTLSKKGGLPGTKIQIKPLFKKKPANSDQASGEEQSPKCKKSDLMMTHATGGVKNNEKSSSSADQSSSTATNGASAARKNPTRSDSLSGVTVSRMTAAEHNLVVEKLQVVLKWGGEPTHAARYQSQDLGENMRKDMLLMNREVVNNVTVFTSSERRVVTSGRASLLC